MCILQVYVFSDYNSYHIIPVATSTGPQQVGKVGKRRDTEESGGVCGARYTGHR